jgi:hypothetical protein
MSAASPREVRAYLQENSERLPEGVSVGQRGRLSQQAKDFFTAETGREVVSPAVSADAE